MKILPLFAFVLLCSSGALPAQNIAPAHGYVTAPISRAYACAQRINSSCGAVSSEPQSVEGPKGFPTTGPADGMIPSAGPPREPFNLDFSPLNIQTPTRWAKQTMQSGQNTFTWNINAGHSTTKWEFFITKSTWSGATTTTPLRREDFDLTPFCTRVDGGVNPGLGTQQFSCNVPQRTGYHIILAVWTIADTAYAFYHVIDADFGGGTTTPPPPPEVTEIFTIDSMPLLKSLGPNGDHLAELLQTNQEVRIIWTSPMWEEPKPIVFPPANTVQTDRVITLTNNLSWGTSVTINGTMLSIPSGATRRYSAHGTTWVLP